MDDKEKIQWHPAFQQAIKAELAEYRDSLSFIEEYQLTTEPLKIDSLIVKKPPGVHIEKNIGRMFRGHNIVEYKSPDDSFSADNYNKVLAYSYLYASLTKTSINDVTVTLVLSKRPVNLMKYLESELSLTVAKDSSGIYYVTGERMPVQIVLSKSLPEEENLWLRSLRGGLGKSTLRQILDESRKHGSEVRAYVYAVLDANRKTMEGDAEMGMGSLAESLVKNPSFVEEIGKLGFVDVSIVTKAAERALQMGDSPEHVAQVLELPLSRVLEIQGNLSKPG